MDLIPEQLFQALSDSTRLRSLILLAHEGELCVCELTHALDVIQPKVSRHLAMLRSAGIVSDRRQGQWIYYQLNADLPAWAKAIIDGAVDGAKNQEPFISDHATLAEMPDRPGADCCA